MSFTCASPARRACVNGVLRGGGVQPQRYDHYSLIKNQRPKL